MARQQRVHSQEYGSRVPKDNLLRTYRQVPALYRFDQTVQNKQSAEGNFLMLSPVY
jgi:hypothetical protein